MGSSAHDISSGGSGEVTSSSYDALSDADHIIVDNPPWGQYEGDPLVDITNGISTTSPGTVYTYYFSPEEFAKSYLSWRLNGGVGGAGIVMKIYMTARDDGTAKESIPAGDWDDITLALTGSATITAAAGADNDDFLVDNGEVMAMAKWIKVELDVDANTGTADWTIWKRQRY